MSESGHDVIGELRGQLEQVRSDNERLSVRLAELEGKGMRSSRGLRRRGGEGGSADASTVSRRSFLGRAGALVAGAVGLAAAEGLTADSADAANGNPLVLGSVNNSSSAPTGLAVAKASSAYGFGVTDGGLNQFPEPAAIAGHTNGSYSSAVLGYAEAGGTGVHGESDTGVGVRGQSSGLYPGVLGYTDGIGIAVEGQASGTAGIGVRGLVTDPSNTEPAVHGRNSGAGNAIRGEGTNPANPQPAIYGQTNGQNAAAIQGVKTAGGGYAVFADIDDPSSGWAASFGLTNGSGPGVLGQNTGSGRGVWGNAQGASGEGVFGEVAAANTSPAVSGKHPGSGPAVKGVSTDGRGGVFQGGAAQLNLVPMATPKHPSAGTAGDLVLDSAGTLFLCTKTGSPATWRKFSTKPA